MSKRALAKYLATTMHRSSRKPTKPIEESIQKVPYMTEEPIVSILAVAGPSKAASATQEFFDNRFIKS